MEGLSRAVLLQGALLAALVCAAGCGGPDPDSSSPLSIVAPDRWEQARGSEPNPDHQSDKDVCPGTGLAVETLGGEPSFQVSTDVCTYYYGQQVITWPDATKIITQINVRLWHAELSSGDASSAAEAHLRLYADAQEIWNVTLPIPQPGKFINQSIDLDTPLEPGSVLGWHVHNHGANSYNLIDIKASQYR